MPYKAIAKSLEIIPKTLSENCGANVVRILTELRAVHAKPDGQSWGIDGHEGKIKNMKDLDIWDPCAVKI